MPLNRILFVYVKKKRTEHCAQSAFLLVVRDKSFCEGISYSFNNYSKSYSNEALIGRVIVETVTSISNLTVKCLLSTM